MSGLIERSLMRERLLSVISGNLGILAMLFAAIGLAATVAQLTASRFREFGIQLALGATQERLIANGLRRALRPVVNGNRYRPVLECWCRPAPEEFSLWCRIIGSVSDGGRRSVVPCSHRMCFLHPLSGRYAK